MIRIKVIDASEFDIPEPPEKSPFPAIKNARFIKNRYRKVWRALFQYGEGLDDQATARKHRDELNEAGYVSNSFEIGDFKVTTTGRKQDVNGWTCRYSTMTVNDSWTIIWGNETNDVGFEGDRQQFEKDAIILAMLLSV